MSSVLKATKENKTTSVTTHFKKLTTWNNVLIVSVIAQSNCHILTFLHQNVQCVRLAAGRRTLKMCCYRSGRVFEIQDGGLLRFGFCRKYDFVWGFPYLCWISCTYLKPLLRHWLYCFPNWRPAAIKLESVDANFQSVSKCIAVEAFKHKVDNITYFSPHRSNS